MSTTVVPPTPAATILAGIIFPVVGGALVALRFYSKHVKRSGVEIEDWLTLPAFVFILGMCFCLVYGVVYKALAYPTPRPADPKDLPTFVAPKITLNRQVCHRSIFWKTGANLLQLEYAVLIAQIPAISCIKLSFLFFYKRVFATPHRGCVTYLIWAMIAICTLWGVSFFFSFVFICGTRFSAFWGPLIGFKMYCQGVLNCNFWLSISDFILDVLIFVFPMPLLWRLQMSLTRKLAVLSIFMIGGLTVAASITRMVIFIRAVVNLRKAYKSTGADNLVITAGLYWTTFECGMGLIAVCLPSAYVLSKQIAEKRFGFRTSDSSNRNNHSSDRYGSIRRNERYKLDGSESDTIPLGVPVITTDIRVEFDGK
ncbi:hypothetical protein K491DRAFT_192913 [Lophiostoma macrostomum CBS 122681]|uniref:Rhodopsin domain-containing protein n=1 Tax=Lophiostoma macrostomum CBS 122681 TaxID=1314788 RepID=A0A6A6TH56_9PLEO|nr:hypothetical protein K491DRAFT_192913 [Lophiostoma macrostomum CBS 122681]